MRRLPTIILLLLLSLVLQARDTTRVKRTHLQKDTVVFSDEYLDSVQVKRKSTINDYSMIGVNYGVTLANFTYNPTKSNKDFVFCPNYFSVLYTHYEKLFGYIANFAFRTGLAYAHEGFTFKTDPETGEYKGDVDGATKTVMDLIEVPVLACMHFDAAPVKFEAEVGVYGGYRKSIDREGPYIPAEYLHSFKDYERRFDYGLRGGAGLVFMIDPVEIHFNAIIRWGWQTFQNPDYSSQYWYRFSYPLDITFTAGIHFQLTKRSGKTSAMLKKQAKEIVYGKTEDPAR